METFLHKMESSIYEECDMDVLDTTLKVTPARWWEMHKYYFLEWGTTQLTLMINFNPSLHANMVEEVYMGKTNPNNLLTCVSISGSKEACAIILVSPIHSGNRSYPKILVST